MPFDAIAGLVVRIARNQELKRYGRIHFVQSLRDGLPEQLHLSVLLRWQLEPPALT
jgi:hypothetical protein